MTKYGAISKSILKNYNVCFNIIQISVNAREFGRRRFMGNLHVSLSIFVFVVQCGLRCYVINFIHGLRDDIIALK